MNPIRQVINWISRNPVLFLGCSGTIALYLFLLLLPENRQFLNFGDLSVYHASSRWAVGQGVLYKDVFSEYPFLANLLFGIVRFVSDLLHPLPTSFRSFTWGWLTLTWWSYIWVTFQIMTKTPRGSLWIWLGPATVFSALLRFDLFPAVATFLALFSLKDEKYTAGAFWIGIAIALKGYLLFALPAFLVFACYQKGLVKAIQLIVICVLPFLLANAIVFGYAGLDGLLVPYTFHTVRTNNGESTYDALLFLSSPFSFYKGKPIDLPSFVKILPLVTSFLAAGLRPKNFNQLMDAFLISVLGFMSFSVFYSPQFILWIAPFACFSTSKKIRSLVAIFSWVTFVYHPLSNSVRYYKLLPSAQVSEFFFGLIILIVSSMRFLVMYFSFRRLLNRSVTEPLTHSS